MRPAEETDECQKTNKSECQRSKQWLEKLGIRVVGAVPLLLQFNSPPFSRRYPLCVFSVLFQRPYGISFSRRFVSARSACRLLWSWSVFRVPVSNGARLLSASCAIATVFVLSPRGNRSKTGNRSNGSECRQASPLELASNSKAAN